MGGKRDTKEGKEEVVKEELIMACTKQHLQISLHRCFSSSPDVAITKTNFSVLRSFLTRWRLLQSVVASGMR